MMTTLMQQPTAANFSREINILTEPTSDRSSKKNALEKILKQLLQQQSADAQDFKNQSILIMKCLMKCLVDPIEKCRELSNKILEAIVGKVEDLYQFLPNLMPFFTARLAQPTIVEPSEEIRLQMVKTLNQIVLRTNESFTPFVEDTVAVLTRTCQDSFQDIRKESFYLIMNLSKTAKRALGLHGGSITKMILPSLNHRHSSVRTVALQALTVSMIVDASAIEDSIEPLRALTRDKTPAVRERLYTLAKDWLTELMDRHVYGVKIVPFLYAGVCDELPKLSGLCIDYLDQVGSQYEKEHNDRIKDELDYSDGVVRPNRPRPGCRHLARDNTQKIIAKQIELLGDWNLEARYQAAKVLTVFMEHTEVNATGYIATMVQPIYKVLAGDEPHVMDQTIKLMEKVGTFISPETTMSLILPALSGSGGSSSTFRIGCLRALQGVLRGSSSKSLESHLPKILSCLSDRDLVQNESVPVIVELAKCFGEIGKKLSNDPTVLFQYFFVLVHLESFPGDSKVTGWTGLMESVNTALIDHAVYLGVPLDSLYLTHFNQGIHVLSETFSNWNQYSYEPKVLKTLLYKGGKKVGENFDKLIPIFAECTKLEKDFELREAILRMCLHLFESLSFDKALLQPFVHSILKDIILSCCIWRAGKKPAVLRTYATQFLSLFLQLFSPLEAVPFLEPLFASDILPTLCSNVDDDEQTTRQHCLSTLIFVLEVPGIWNADAFKKLYPELLKRMDDAKDQVRIHTASVWAAFFPAVKTWMGSLALLKGPEDEGKLTTVKDGQVIELGLDRGHYETIIDGLLIHLDDPDQNVQEAVCLALLAGKQNVFDATLLHEKVHNAFGKHKSRLFLDRLIQ